MSNVSGRPPVSVHNKKARTAAALAFFIDGAIFGNWVPRIPEIKSGLNLDNGDLGLALLGTALGSFLAIQAAGLLMSRRGSATVVRIGGPAFALSLLLIPFIGNGLWTLAIALTIVGFANGTLDIGVNGQGVGIERTYKRPLINAMHAQFSLGGVSGALTGGLAATHGLSVASHFAIVAVVGTLLSLMISPWLLSKEAEDASAPAGRSNDPEAKHAPFRAVMTKPTIVLGLLSLAAFVAEGGLIDWITVYMREDLLSSAGAAAFAFGAFQAAMTIVRLFADRVVGRYGAVNVLRFNTAVGAVGLAVGLLSGNIIIAIVGFAMAGLGVSVNIPLLFSAAGHAPSVDSARTLATVSGFGYFGFFVGPPLIGGVADAFSLEGALFIPVVLTLLICLCASNVRGASGGTVDDGHVAKSQRQRTSV